MRILKRNLAFMLAMIMALSLTAFAGYEDYPDVDELTYVEAVDVLTELGIVEGSNGKLMPTGDLTRAQAAKLIAYTMLGKKAADALQADVAPFVDVPTYHWAAGYVEYCADQGIVGGNGDGTFAPEENVTASQFAKMLLCAVGYGENGEFTGPSWDSTVNSMATKLGVFDKNLDVVFADDVTREEAFLYTFNALTKVMEVTYSEDADEYYAGTVFNSIKGFDFDETLGAKLYNLNTKEGTDAFGRDGYFWYKNNKKITGLYTYGADATYTASVKSKTMFADLDLDDATWATVYHNGEQVADFQIKKNSGTTLPGSGNGVLVEAYVDGDLNVEIVMIDTYMAVVTDATEEKEVWVDVYFAADTITEMKYSTDAEYAVGDYVLVTVETVGEDSIQSMVAPTEVPGKLTKDSASYIEIDDEKINHAAMLVKEPDAVKYGTTKEDIYLADNGDHSHTPEMIALLDEYGYALGLVKAPGEDLYNGYVLVVGSYVEEGTGSKLGALEVEVLHMDGTGYEFFNLPVRRDGRVGARVTQFKDTNGNWNQIGTDADGNDVIENGFYGYYVDDNDCIVLRNLKANELQVLETTGANDKIISADDSQALTFGTKTDAVLNNSTVLNLVYTNDVETVEGYKNIELNLDASEDKVNALVVLNSKSGRVVEEMFVVNGNLVNDDIYAYWNGEFHHDSSGTEIKMYHDGEYFWYDLTNTELDTKAEVAQFLLDNTDGSTYNKDTNNAEGIYKIELDGDDLDLAALQLIKKENVSTYTVFSKNVSELFYTLEGYAGKYHYAADVKIWDVTDGGAVSTINKNDRIVVVRDDLVTHIFITGVKNTEGSNDTVNNYNVVVANKTPNAVRLNVTGAVFTDITVDAYHTNGNLYATDVITTWSHVEGTTYSGVAVVSDTTDLFFVVNVKGVPVDQTDILRFN